jgi:4-amino-4-deoxy-L-arabinose transferase-like glycosyltransferase
LEIDTDSDSIEMNSLILTIHLFTNGLCQVTIPPTDPTHLYFMETSTNLSAGWDNQDGTLFVGSTSPQPYFEYPPRPQEFFCVVDLGQVF